MALSAGDGMCEDRQAMRADVADELAIEALRRHGRLRLRVRGGSMAPFMRDGDVVSIGLTPAGGPRIGDIICYEPRVGRLFVHRVVAYTRDHLVVKGDALAVVEHVARERVLGTVVALERRGTPTRLDSAGARLLSRVIAAFSPAIPKLLPMALHARRAWRAVRG